MDSLYRDRFDVFVGVYIKVDPRDCGGHRACESRHCPCRSSLSTRKRRRCGFFRKMPAAGGGTKGGSDDLEAAKKKMAQLFFLPFGTAFASTFAATSG